MGTPKLNRLIKVLGVCYLLVMAGEVALSYVLVTVGPFGWPQPNEANFFSSLAGSTIFQNEFVFAVSAELPILISTVIFVSLIVLIRKYESEIDPATVRRLFRWSATFAIVQFFALPVFAQDFWLSLAWGKMALAGINPYYTELTQAFQQDLPLDIDNHLKMTYGPLWALISAAIVFVSQGNVVLSAMLFKLLLVGSWIGSLYLVWKLLDGYPLSKQALGIVIFGWLPLSITQVSAEGHNDILMIFFMLLWLYKLEKREVGQATFALALSALIKYVTFPLFLVEVFYLVSLEKGNVSAFRRKHVLAFVPSVLLIIGVFAFFYRSTTFFAATSAMSTWDFLTPQKAIADLLGLLRLPYLSYVSAVARLLPHFVFFGAVIYSARRYYQLRSVDSFRRLVLALMTAILFSVVGHVWPWFLLWVIPLSALLPTSLLSRWNLGVAIAFPLAVIVMQFAFLPSFFIWDLTGLAIYGFATISLLTLPRIESEIGGETAF